MGRTPKQKTKINVDDLPPIYKCTKCGKVYQEPKGHFYMARSWALYDANEHYSHICVYCANDHFEELKMRFRDERLALILTCSSIGLYYSDELYESARENGEIRFGDYIKKLNMNQFKSKNFGTFLINLLKEVQKPKEDVEDERESRWTVAEQRNKNEIISIIGYDPFESYSTTDRRFLFNELIKYIDEDTADDTYKLSQIIQIVNNNNQIRGYDLVISRLDPMKDSEVIRNLGTIKTGLVTANDKIAKENEISVKNRSNKELGKSTLGYLQRDLREKDFTAAESNYYDQLRSAGSQWAADMSHKAILSNAMFDENDRQEIFEIQRKKLVEIQTALDEALEKNRLLTIDNNGLRERLNEGAANG